jgi:hypothetical protein
MSQMLAIVVAVARQGREVAVECARAVVRYVFIKLPDALTKPLSGINFVTIGILPFPTMAG